jgi:hypothetical protein
MVWGAVMHPIDRPFRFTLDFCIVWLVLAVPTYLLTRRWDIYEPTWSFCSLVLLLSLFATFCIYGPVILARQIIRSGSHGWFVARVFVSVLLVTVMFFGVLYISGHGKDVSGIWGGVAAFAAITYLHWKLGR